MIDTHCHLYSSEFDEDAATMMLRAQAAGVSRFFMPAIDSQTHEKMLDVEMKYPKICFAMIGLHPCSVKDDFLSELQIVEQYLQQRKFSAIGETGLDFYWDKSFIQQQYEALEYQAELALQYNIPIVLHTRNAIAETIEVMEKYSPKGLRGIFHCFGGTIEEANNIINMGFLLGIGGVVTYKKSGLDEVLKHIPMKFLVLETDAPYLSPVPHRGKRNESAYLGLIAQKIADVKDVAVEEVIQATNENALEIFKLHANDETF